MKSTRDKLATLKSIGVSKRRAEISDAAEVREKCRMLIEQALLSGEGGGCVGGVQVIASEIEQELFGLNGSCVCREYKAAVRKLTFNLKQNEDLRASVTGHRISPGQLCRKQSIDLGTAERRLETAALQARTLARSTLTDDKGIATTAYKCPECGANDAHYNVLAGRRDIGKSETWGSAESPAPGIQIYCLQCRHSWKREMA